MTKHWFHSFLTQHYSSGKKLGLDLGSGKRNWQEFVKCECIGLDLPTELKNKKNEQPDVCATALNLPFKSNTFDFLFSYSAFPYIEGTERVFDEMYRVMKPNSTAVIIIQNLRGIKLHENEQNYANKFDSRTLHKKLFSHGFRSIKHKNLKVLFYSTYYNLTSVYAYAIIEPIKKTQFTKTKRNGAVN